MGYIPATLRYVDIKFTGHVDTRNICCLKFLKLGLSENLASERVKFLCRPQFGPPWRTNLCIRATHAVLVW